MPDIVLRHEPADVDLDEWLAQRAADIDNEPENFAPIDRLLGVCRYLARRRAEVEATYAERIAELQAWRDDRFAVIDGRHARVAERLEGFARAMHERSGGRDKTWKLANGTLEIRAAQPVVELLGSPEVVGRALAENGHDTLTTTKRTTSKTMISDALAAESVTTGPLVEGYVPPQGRETYTGHLLVTSTGERLPGVVLLVPTRDRFNLRTAAPVAAEPDADLPEEVTS